MEKDTSVMQWFDDHIRKESQIIDLGIMTAISKYNGGDQLVNNHGILYLIPAKMKGGEDGFINPLYFINSMVASLYMARRPTGHVDDSIFIPIDSERIYVQSSVRRLLRKLNRSIDTSMLFNGRIVSKNHSANLALVGDERVDPTKRTTYVGVLSYTHDNILETVVIHIDLNKSEQILTCVPRISYYVGDRQDVIIEARRLETDVSYTINSRYVMRLQIIEKILEAILDGYDTEYGEHPSYTENEIKLVRLAGKMMERRTLKFVTSSYLLAESDFDLRDFNDFKVDEDSHIMLDKIDDIPLIDFSTKEWKFVDRYWEQQETHNIRDALIEPRYGNMLKLDDGEVEMIISYAMDAVKNIMTLYITSVISSTTSACVEVNIEHLDDYVSTTSVKGIQVILKTTDPGILPASFDDLCQMSPIFGWKPAEIMYRVQAILEIFTVIHDRPQRSRIVRCTEQVSRTHKHGKRQTTTQEYKVTRILKPIKEAKQLVDEYNHREPGERRAAEYTMEAWERVGHTRTYKNGKTIYINETTCHRHKPLSDKELHVKL